MKNLLITISLFVLLSISFKSSSQALEPVGTKYDYAFLTSYFDFSQQFYASYIFDTITISGKVYSNITYFGPASGGLSLPNYILRLDSGKLYWYRDNKEYLIFDYNSKVADSVNINCYYFQKTNQLWDTLIYSKVRIDSIAFDTLIKLDTLRIPIKNYYYSTKLIDKRTNTLRVYNAQIYERILSLIQTYSRPFIGVNWGAIALADDHTYLRCIERSGMPTLKSKWWQPYSKYYDCLVQGFDITVGVNEIKPLNSFSIYPNPASRTISIEQINPNFKLSTIQIYDAIGSLVKAISASEKNKMEIGVSELNNGYYYIIFVGQNGTTVPKKLLISR